MAVLRGWLTPQTYKQAERSIFRETVVLSSLQAEAAGDLLRDSALALTAFAPVIAGETARVQAFLRDIDRRLSNAHELKQMNREPMAGANGSIDVLLRLHKAMMDAGMIKKKGSSPDPAGDAHG